MDVNCTPDINLTKVSLQIVSEAQMGYWITLILAILGLFSNILLLFMFHNLRWFKQPLMILFWNLAIVDLLTCISALYLYSILLYESSRKTSDVQKLTRCYEKIIPFHFFTTVSERFALAIAVDRLMSKWLVFKWLQIGARFRRICVVICWISSTIGAFMFYSDVLSKDCIISCLGCLNYARNWHQIVVVIVDNTINVAVIIVYIVIPIVTALSLKSCLKDLTERDVIIFGPQQRLLAEVRLLSAVYVLLFLLSMTIGEFFGEIITSVFDADVYWLNVSETVCSIGRIVNSVYHFYFWIFISKKFRMRFVSLMICSLKRRSETFNL